MQGPLLEWVFYRSVGIDREDKWMEWYDFHHYLMVQVPGWNWARMYRAIIGNEKYLSLYRVEDYEALQQVYGWPDPEAGRDEIIENQLHPILHRDVNDKAARGLLDTGQHMFNGGSHKDTGHWGWRQLAGAPFDDPLVSHNAPIGFELVNVPADKMDAWRSWYVGDRFPRLVGLPGVTMGGVFEITSDDWDEEPRFRFGTLFELRDEQAAFDIGGTNNALPEAIDFWNDPDAVSRYGEVGERLINYYEPISKHWSFKKVAWEK
jgi:hypothetical protein